jgi:hypothetical protein
MAVRHPQVRSVTVEGHQLLRALAEALVVCPRHPHIALELREAAGAARQALGDAGHGEQGKLEEAPVSTRRYPARGELGSSFGAVSIARAASMAA